MMRATLKLVRVIGLETVKVVCAKEVDSRHLKRDHAIQLNKMVGVKTYLNKIFSIFLLSMAINYVLKGMILTILSQLQDQSKILMLPKSSLDSNAMIQNGQSSVGIQLSLKTNGSI